MLKANNQKLYTSPEVRVVEIKARQILCQSNLQKGTLGTMGSVEGEW